MLKIYIVSSFGFGSNSNEVFSQDAVLLLIDRLTGIVVVCLKERVDGPFELTDRNRWSDL